MIKNLPVVDFYESVSGNTVDNHMASVATGAKNLAPVTIFAVVKATTVAGGNWIAGYGAGSLPDGPDVAINSGSYAARDAVNTAGWAGADTSAHVVTGVITNAAGANIVLRVDGTQRAITAASGPAYGPGQLLIGGAPTIAGVPPTPRFLQGVIGEVLMYQGINLTVQQWQLNESYLKTKWGTP